MKWIELNNGSLVNVESLACIKESVANTGLGSAECKIYYLGDMDYVGMESFETTDQVERRMQQLRQMLLLHDAAKEILEHTIPYATL